MDTRLLRLLDATRDGHAPSKAECAALLEYPAASPEASLLRATADAVSRQRFGNEAIILGQLGVAIAPCPGNCGFCSFGEEHTHFTSSAMSDADILGGAERFTASGDLYALFLMTMHTYDFDRLIDAVCTIRRNLPTWPQIVVNIGDFDRTQAGLLREAGVNGAYHVLRLREGTDTALDPGQRKRTIKAIRDAGLDWYYCCEPIGPEHTNAEIVEQIFLGIEYGCFQHAAMRRVYIPSVPLSRYGQISDLRLGHVTAVIALASLACPTTKNIAVHEPNLIGLTSGANVVYAEAGANPRDIEADTTGHRGRDVVACKTMLFDAGFDRLSIAPGRHRSLADAYRNSGHPGA